MWQRADGNNAITEVVKELGSLFGHVVKVQISDINKQIETLKKF